VKTNGRLKEGVFVYIYFLFFITEANQDAFLRKCHSYKIEDSIHITLHLYVLMVIIIIIIIIVCLKNVSINILHKGDDDDDDDDNNNNKSPTTKQT